MALEVEDGTAKVNSESFISVAEADTYHDSRGNAAWAALSTPVKEQSLRKAADFMTQMFRQRWKGYRKTATQAMDWPRTFVYLEPFTHGATGAYPYLVLDTVVPVEVKNANAELALRASTAALIPDQTRTTLSERVGEIAVTYDPSSSVQTSYKAVELMIGSYLAGTSFNVAVGRR